MKKFTILLLLLFCGLARADTETINWYVGTTLYDTTSCQTGGDIILPTQPTKRGHTFQGWYFYTPIEYLESTGTQYINTGYIPTPLTRTEIELKFTENFKMTGTSFFGTANYTANFGTSSSGGKQIFFWFCVYQSSGCTATPNLMLDPAVTTTKQTLVFDPKNKRVSYGTAKIQNITATARAATQPMYLFAKNNGSSVDIFSARGMYVYAMRIYEDDILVRDIIPVLDENGVACMFDKMSSTFFYNAGTGNFAAGPIIGE